MMQIDWLAVAESTCNSVICIFDRRPEPPYDDKWKAEDEWFEKDFVPYEGIDYGPLREYAQREYDNVSAANESIDEKSAWLFGVVVLGMGASFSVSQSWELHWLWLILSWLSGFVSLHLALKTRVPDKKIIPSSVRSMLEIDQKGYRSCAWIVAAYHCAIEGLIILNRWKGIHLQAAARFLILSMMFFAVAVLISQTNVLHESDQSDETTVARQNRTVLGSAPEVISELGDGRENRWKWEWNWQ